MKVLMLLTMLLIYGGFGECDIRTIQKVIMKNIESAKFLDNGKCSEQKLRNLNYHSDDLQTLVEKLFKKIQEILDGNDPFSYQNILEFNNDGYGLIMKGRTGKYLIQGISTMNVTKLVATNSDKLHFELNLEFSNLEMNGIYNFTFDILTMLPLCGGGDISAIFPSLALNITMDLVQTEGSQILQISDSLFKIKIPTYMVDFENLLGIDTYSKLLNKILNETADDLMQESEHVLNVGLNAIAKKQINNALCTYGVTYAKMIDVIKHIIE